MFYVVIGRTEFDDNEVRVYEDEPSREAARARFEREMKAENAEESLDEDEESEADDEDETRVYTDFIIECETRPVAFET